MARERRAIILVENQSVPRDRRVWQVARALTQAGVEIAVVCPQGEGIERSLYEERDGIAIRRFPLRPSAGGMRGYIREYAVAMRSMRRILKELCESRLVDVVHACNPPDTLLLVALAARRQGAALVFDHHDLAPELFRTRFGERRLLYGATIWAERLAFALSDVVISTNESYRRVALSRGKRRPEDVFIVRNAPDLEQFRPIPPNPSLRRGADHLLAYVGVMGPQDGIDHALYALEELGRRRRDWHAVFVGDGDMLASMQQLAADLGLAGAVEFTGWLEPERVVEIVGSADVCLAPDPPSPLNDVSSMIKVVEYMAMSRAIASYSLAETRAAAAGAAAYASDSDPTSLAAVVAELLDDPNRRARMGAEGRRRVEAGLAWEHQEPVLLAAYERAFSVADRRRGER